MTVAEQEHSGGHLLHVLHPGGVACGERGERFETLLGSCVAIVLTDPRRTVGAMCHIVHAMPAPAGRHDDATYENYFDHLARRSEPPTSTTNRATKKGPTP